MIIRDAKSSLHQLLIILLIICVSRHVFCLETDTINSTLVLRDSDTIHSAGNQFTLGFFSPNGTTRRYVGIWYYVHPSSVGWVANRETPLNDTSGTFSISSRDGNLVLTDGENRVIWSTNVASSSTNSTTALLMDSGNLVLRDGSSGGTTLWESFKYPVNAFFPTMKLTHNTRTGQRIAENSWRTSQDPGRGNFTSGLDATSIAQIFIWENGVPRWRSGPWNGRVLTGITGMYTFYVDGFSLGTEDDGTQYFTLTFRKKMVSYFFNASGVILEGYWNEQKSDWNVTWIAPANDCDLYNNCGAFSVCYIKSRPICSCLRGYEPRNKGEWDRRVWNGGCVRRVQLQCDRENNATDKHRGDGFNRMTFIKVPDFMQFSPGLETECANLCLRNCSCLAYAHDPGIGCMFWNGTLIDVQKFAGDAGLDFFVRVPYSEIDKEKSHKLVIAVSVVASLVATFLCLSSACWLCKRKAKHKTLLHAKGERNRSASSEIALQSDLDNVNIEELPLYSFEILATATNNFDLNSKLGMGGFGPVYKGKLPNGNEIAVKRLSTASGQGYEEFMNEVLVISKLQHRNLVRLLGCCALKEEKMLIYEYMQNRSLDIFLFDKKQDVLDWKKRFNIMEGIGRGLLYLHRDSRLRIIHRDLKPSNILLDEWWNPKISDFGMARIFGGNQDQANTGKVVGTYGYMAPEYAMGGRFSEKSDVFGYGVLVLEIISGRRNTSFYNDESSSGLLGYAWKLWNEENAGDLIDKRISGPGSEAEIMRCLHIGLLCVQEFPINRPNISTILSMLSSEIVDLPMPENPGFTNRWSHTHVGTSSTSSPIPSVNHITHTVVEGR